MRKKNFLDFSTCVAETLTIILLSCLCPVYTINIGSDAGDTLFNSATIILVDGTLSTVVSVSDHEGAFDADVIRDNIGNMAITTARTSTMTGRAENREICCKHGEKIELVSKQ